VKTAKSRIDGVIVYIVLFFNRDLITTQETMSE